MKRFALCLLGCGLISILGCGKETPPTSTPPTPVAAAPAVTGIPWITSVPDAEAQAKKENKLVLLNFTGSDWCAACKVLDNEVFSKPAFVDFANKNLVMVMLDYPFGTKLPDALEKANNALKDKYKIEGYPTVIILKPDGESIWTNLGVPDGGLTNMLDHLQALVKK